MLEAKGLTKVYRNTKVLDGVSFYVAPGETLGVAGHNGSGKSTLLSIVAQMLIPTGGSLLYNGQSIMGDRSFMRKMVGYVPQQNCLLDDLTVFETLNFFLKAYELKNTDLFAPNSPAAVLGLKEIAKKRVGALSGGMQKRLSLALALLHNPKVLVLDEVLGALDLRYRNAFRSWMAAYVQQGGSILYCSHETEELRQLCRRMLLLRQGKVVFYDAVENFPTDPERLDVLLNPVS